MALQCMPQWCLLKQQCQFCVGWYSHVTSHSYSDTMTVTQWQGISDSTCMIHTSTMNRIHVHLFGYGVGIFCSLCKCFCHFTSHLHVLDGTALYTMLILRSFKAGTVRDQNPHLPPTPWYVCLLAYNLLTSDLSLLSNEYDLIILPLCCVCSIQV